MKFSNQNYYEILDVRPDAPSEEINRAFKLLKRTFAPDSLATYQVYSPEECEIISHKIEEAYRVLISPVRRKTYDTYLDFMEEGAGGVDSIDDFYRFTIGREGANQESRAIGAARSTYPGHSEEKGVPSPAAREEIQEGGFTRGGRPPFDGRDISGKEGEKKTFFHFPWREKGMEAFLGKDAPRPEPLQEKPLSPAFLKMIEEETEFRGEFFKRVREGKGIRIEEIAERTKINIAYLLSIEEDNYKLLPESAYVRGFIEQYASLLRLDVRRCVEGFMRHFMHIRGEKI